MQNILRLIARLIVARHECTYVRHCKENAPIHVYYVAPETPMVSSVIADYPDLAPPNILDKSTPMIQRLCTWNQKEGKTKETLVVMIREDCEELRMTSMAIDERQTRAMASPGPSIKEN